MSIRVRLTHPAKERPYYLVHDRQWALYQSNGENVKLVTVSDEPVLFSFALDDATESYSPASHATIVPKVEKVVKDFCAGWGVNMMSGIVTMPKPVPVAAPEPIPLPDSILDTIKVAA